MMGLYTPSTSFCWALNSSTSASWMLSSHLMASSHISVITLQSGRRSLGSSVTADAAVAETGASHVSGTNVFRSSLLGAPCHSPSVARSRVIPSSACPPLSG